MLIVFHNSIGLLTRLKTDKYSLFCLRFTLSITQSILLRNSNLTHFVLHLYFDIKYCKCSLFYISNSSNFIIYTANYHIGKEKKKRNSSHSYFKNVQKSEKHSKFELNANPLRVSVSSLMPSELWPINPTTLMQETQQPTCRVFTGHLLSKLQ